jgi:phospholipase/carboxylesterase
VRTERIAGLDCVVVGEGAGPLVVLLHGFGAPGTDLVGLSQALRASPGTRFVFPAAPVDLSRVFGFDARAWWMIDMMALERARAAGEVRMLRHEVPPELEATRRGIDALLDALVERMTPTSIALGGFSQGAMLSMDVALHTRHALSGVVLLSGALLAERVWRPKMLEHPKAPVFQSHGTHDPVLSFQGAEDLRDALVDAGWDVDFVPFRGQHEIPPGVLARASQFLGRVLS